MREELEQLKDVIEMLKEELLLLQDKHDKDYKLLNDRLDEMAIKLRDNN